MPATTDRTPALTGELYEIALSTLETVNWSLDQADVLTRAALDNARTMRHDGYQVVEKMVAQAKANHEEVAHMMEAGVKSMMHYVPGWDSLTLDGMRQQLNDLWNRVEPSTKK